MKHSIQGKQRCPWADPDKLDYLDYHDREWGVPVHDDRTLFEFLLLESAQAGLSWYMVLKKRPHYRRVFDNFEIAKVAGYGEDKVTELLADPGIIRNRRKVKAAVHNARVVLDIQESFGSFSNYLWRFVDGNPRINTFRCQADCPVTSLEAEALSKDFRRRGGRFFGPVIAYAYMQAVGMVNDHLTGCFRRSEIIRDYPHMPSC